MKFWKRARPKRRICDDYVSALPFIKTKGGTGSLNQLMGRSFVFEALKGLTTSVPIQLQSEDRPPSQQPFWSCRTNS